MPKLITLAHCEKSKQKRNPRNNRPEGSRKSRNLSQGKKKTKETTE